MRIFISAGEPSGDLHGANLIQALRRQRSAIEFVGFGGDKMEASGCQLLFPLSQLAVIGFLPVLGYVPTFLNLVSRADRYFGHQRPDAVILIDYPGFNWWMARRAHFHGIPVFYFVPPQLWAWAGWRVKKMQRFVDHVLCTLPFEPQWYRERGVNAHYVGHPYFDELEQQRLDESFVATQQARGPIVALLPGSRDQEVSRNLPTLLAAAARVHTTRPDVRFLVANFKDAHRQMTDAHFAGRNLPVETFVGRTPEIIKAATACVAVSGSVGLELLYHGTPSVVVYKISALDVWLCKKLQTAPYISLVNLLAHKELFPEFLTDRCEAEAVAGHITGWLADEEQRLRVRAELAALRRQMVRPGACSKAASHVLQVLDGAALLAA
jgi:lipid-A-disaccharide synthase